MACGLNYTIVEETPAMHAQNSVAEFIQQEVRNPAKQWVDGILGGTREREEVILRTDAYVLLPDTERANRYWRVCARPRQGRPAPTPMRTLNWLAILQDRGVRTLRDLRGHHLPMLRAMLRECMDVIERETGLARENVMAYVHYPPSVYQLHVHFSSPYGQFCHKEAYRMHPLQTVISNLELDPDYYQKVTLCIPVLSPSPHLSALSGGGDWIQTRAPP
jgi:m7GpppX diphosphatase